MAAGKVRAVERELGRVAREKQSTATRREPVEWRLGKHSPAIIRRTAPGDGTELDGSVSKANERSAA